MCHSASFLTMDVRRAGFFGLHKNLCWRLQEEFPTEGAERVLVVIVNPLQACGAGVGVPAWVDYSTLNITTPQLQTDLTLLKAQINVS